MTKKRKKSTADLRNYYTIFMQLGLIATLLVFIVAAKLNLQPGDKAANFTQEQEIVEIEEIERTEQTNDPPPPPRPPVPVEVPNDEIIEDEVLDLDAELDFNDPMDMPPPPAREEEEEDEEDFFRVVENMPELQGGMQTLYDCIEYPSRARRAGIEGTVTVQFIVNEQGQVESPTVLRGVEGLNDEAIRCIEASSFSPGNQRGNPVRVQMSLPVRFTLK